MNHTKSAAIAIGAPGSIARYISDNSWGNNKFAVVERVNGEFVLRAAQTTKHGAMRHYRDKLLLVDIENVRILSWPGIISIDCSALAQIELALETIKSAATGCLEGDIPLIARQTFACPLRNIAGLAARALKNIPKE